MLYLLKAAALGAVLSIKVLTLCSAPSSAQETALPGSAQTLGARVTVPERSTATAPALPDDTPAVENAQRRRGDAIVVHP
jgi:hypothetical protein